jgi:hypothetical protein
MAIRLIEELIERDAYTDILFLAGSSMVERTAAGEADCHVRIS